MMLIVFSVLYMQKHTIGLKEVTGFEMYNQSGSFGRVHFTVHWSDFPPNWLNAMRDEGVEHDASNHFHSGAFLARS